MKNKIVRDIDVHLYPGEVYIVKKPMIISTPLGSCISIVLISEIHKISAISHAQLPVDNSEAQCSAACPVKCNRHVSKTKKLKYVTCSTSFMLEKLISLGVKKREIKVKIVGGSHAFNTPNLKSVGEQNIEIAHEMVEYHKLNLVGEDTGGKSGRTIYFNSSTGKVLIRNHSDNEVKML